MVIPSNKGSKENTDYASLQRQDYAELGGPDYAELTNQDYAELQGSDYAELESSSYADQGGPDYAELEPEGEQYASMLNTTEDSGNGSCLSSNNQDATYQAINKNEPVYHVLESTCDSPIADRRGFENYQDGLRENIPVYHELEQEGSCAKGDQSSNGTISGGQSKKNASLGSARGTSENVYEPILCQESHQENMYQALDESAGKSSKRNTYTTNPRPKLKTNRSMTTFAEVSSECTEPCIRSIAKSKPGKKISKTGHDTENVPESEYLKPVISSANFPQSGKKAEKNDYSTAEDSSTEYLQPIVPPS